MRVLELPATLVAAIWVAITALPPPAIASADVDIALEASFGSPPYLLELL